MITWEQNDDVHEVWCGQVAARVEVLTGDRMTIVSVVVTGESEDCADDEVTVYEAIYADADILEKAKNNAVRNAWLWLETQSNAVKTALDGRSE